MKLTPKGLTQWTEGTPKHALLLGLGFKCILGGGFPLPATPKGQKRGHLFNDDKNSVKSFLGVPRVRIDRGQQF